MMSAPEVCVNSYEDLKLARLFDIFSVVYCYGIDEQDYCIIIE